MSRRRLDGVFGAEHGSELVEMAVVMPIFLIVIMAIMDFGFVFQRYEVVNNAAREGARLAVVGSHTNAAVETRVQNYLTYAGLTGTATIQAGDTSVDIGGVVVPTKTVTVLYPSTFMFLPGSVNLQGIAHMRLEGGGS